MEDNKDQKPVKKKATRKKSTRKKAVKKKTSKKVSQKTQAEIDLIAKIAEEEIERIKQLAEEEIDKIVEYDEPTESDIDRIARIAKEKEKATKEHEPYIAILNMEVDYDNINAGSFEFDWNDVFITRLLKAGYQGKTDADLVDQWFNNVCRHVVLETYEQEQADIHPIKSTKLKDGRRGYE